MANPVIHFEISGNNGEALMDFYRQLFDWNIDANNPMNYGMVEAHEGGIGGGVSASPEGPEAIFYVGVDDVQAALDKAEQLGGKTLMPPMEIPDAGVTIARMADLEGNVIGLVKNQAVS